MTRITHAFLKKVIVEMLSFPHFSILLTFCRRHDSADWSFKDSNGLPKLQSESIKCENVLKIVGHFTPSFGFFLFRASQNFYINVYDIPYLIAMKNSHWSAVALSDSAMRFSTSFFFMNQFLPKPLSIEWGLFQIFSKIFGDIRSSGKWKKSSISKVLNI